MRLALLARTIAASTVHQEDSMAIEQSISEPAASGAIEHELRSAVRGEIVMPLDAGYAEAARIWNGDHDGHHPAVIVRATTAADVTAAVGIARRNDLPIAVRGGGHSVPGFSTGDGVMVIDLSPMNDVHVDAAARMAKVGGGAVWADVDAATQEHGLATTGGLVSTTGVAGFTLGGGIGWLMRKHGLACDNLLAAEVVTADGRVVRASQDENPDLLWGLRGGGGNFGVVTQFEFALHPVGPMVYAGPIFFPGDAAGDLLRAFRSWSRVASYDVTAVVNLTAAPPLPVIPQEWHGRKVAVLIATSSGALGGAEAHFRELRAVAEPVADLLGPMPYAAIQTLFDPLWAKGTHAYFKATNRARLDDELIERLRELQGQAPGPQCEIHLHQMDGAVAEVDEQATAFPERTMPYVLNAMVGWHDPGLGEAHRDWARAVIESARDASTGRAYVNYLGDAQSARSAYGAETYRRLVALKQSYDPTNVFRLNQNIQPWGDQ
jgi:FAD/FMN-containing dehydrogenase